MMKKEIGLWIDHQKAVIVSVHDGKEEVKEIIYRMEKHVRYRGRNDTGMSAGEDVRDRRYGNHLNSFYNEVIALLRDADSIQIFGSGEAKGQLEKHIKHEGLKARIFAIETEDKMTDRQIVAKVRDYLRS